MIPPHLHLLDAVDLIVLRQAALDARDGAVALQDLGERKRETETDVNQQTT